MSSYWNYRECNDCEQVCGGTPDDDIFPADLARKIEERLSDGWQLDEQGRITGGTTYDGMTPAEVIAERDAYRRMVGE